MAVLERFISNKRCSSAITREIEKWYSEGCREGKTLYALPNLKDCCKAVLYDIWAKGVYSVFPKHQIFTGLWCC